ncbi:hypothetical protein BC835DRAFT_1410841 [Cytidiella melzeri]|nr:hypothetical protein BC835DRAFT_1410841 [Cytidiella melzeri]
MTHDDDDDDDLGQGAEGIPLIEQPADGTTIRRKRSAHTSSRRGASWPIVHVPTILVVVAGVLLTTTIVSGLAALTTVVSRRNAAANDLQTKVDAGSLKRPSLYLGLDRVSEIKTNGLTFGSTTGGGGGMMDMGSAPTMSGQREKVGRVSSLYPDERFELNGWVLITESDHAIMNLTIPSGPGTQCILHASFPSRRDIATSDTLLTIELDSSSSSVKNPSTSPLRGPTISLAALGEDLNFDLKTLTWSTRPPPMRTLGSLVAGFNATDSTNPFLCSSSGWILIEAACAGKGCRVEYEFGAGSDERLLGEPLDRLVTLRCCYGYKLMQVFVGIGLRRV